MNGVVVTKKTFNCMFVAEEPRCHSLTFKRPTQTYTKYLDKMVTVNPTEILFSSINVAILSRPTMEFLPTRCLSCNSWNTSLEVSRNRTLELDQFMMALRCIQLYRMNLYDNKPQVACPYHQITSSSRQLLHGHNNILLTQVWKDVHSI